MSHSERERRVAAAHCPHRLDARLPSPFLGGDLPRRLRRSSLILRLRERGGERQGSLAARQCYVAQLSCLFSSGSSNRGSDAFTLSP